MQRVIIDYGARKVNISGTPTFASSYSDVYNKQIILDNAVEVSTGDITLSQITPLISPFTATNSNYLQLTSVVPFYIKTTIGGSVSAVQKTSIFAYHNTVVPIDSIELYSGTSIYDPVSGLFSVDGGTVTQIVTYMQLKF